MRCVDFVSVAVGGGLRLSVTVCVTACVVDGVDGGVGVAVADDDGIDVCVLDTDVACVAVSEPDFDFAECVVVCVLTRVFEFEACGVGVDVRSQLNDADFVARNVGVAVWSLLSVTDFDRRMLGVDVCSALRDTVSDSRSVRVKLIGCVSVGGTYSHIGSIVYGKVCAVVSVVPLYAYVPASL